MCTFVRVRVSPGTEDTDNFEMPCRSWELNTGPLEEQSLLTAEPFLQVSRKTFDLSGSSLSSQDTVGGSSLH